MHCLIKVLIFAFLSFDHLFSEHKLKSSTPRAHKEHQWYIDLDQRPIYDRPPLHSHDYVSFFLVVVVVKIISFSRLTMKCTTTRILNSMISLFRICNPSRLETIITIALP